MNNGYVLVLGMVNNCRIALIKLKIENLLQSSNFFKELSNLPLKEYLFINFCYFPIQ